MLVSTMTCKKGHWNQAWLCSVLSVGGEQREMDTHLSAFSINTFPSTGNYANEPWLWPSWKWDAFLFWRTGNNTAAYPALIHTRVYVWMGAQRVSGHPYLTCLISTMNSWYCHWRIKKWRHKWKSTGSTVSPRMPWANFKPSADTHVAASRIWINCAKKTVVTRGIWNYISGFSLWMLWCLDSRTRPALSPAPGK